MILLNPGPVNVSERVRRALSRPDICHRESEFSELLNRIQQKLLTAFVPGAEAEYVAVVLTGSGTAAVESAVMSCLPAGKRMLVLNNGVYGERISSMVGLHRLGVSELKWEWHSKPDPERVRLALRQHPEVHAVAMVHHETTTGLINPVQEIAEVVDSQNRVFVVDSVSGLGGEAIDVAGSHLQESHAFSCHIVPFRHFFTQGHHASPLHDHHTFLAGLLHRVIHQQTVGEGRFDQPAQDFPVKQHIRIHDDDVV